MDGRVAGRLSHICYISTGHVRAQANLSITFNGLCLSDMMYQECDMREAAYSSLVLDPAASLSAASR